MKSEKIYLLNRGLSPVSFILQSRDKKTRRLLFFDEKKGMNRSLRYASNQKSVFVDEQDDNFICEPIIFEDGKLSVPNSNPILQEFLSKHPDNGSLFRLFDPEQQAAEKVEYEDAVLDAKIKIREMSEDKMRSLLNVFEGAYDKNDTKVQLRNKMNRLADSDPWAIIDAMDDPEVVTDDMATRAINDGHVSVRNNGKDIHYNLKDNKKRLLVVPTDETPSQSLGRWFKTVEGQDFYTYLLEFYEE